ncbi:hypothetical protein MmiEs2_05020 [Methanimicrococcus stummii]|uniref:Uncharacterized protein n=1 Tax=Methanimicrococcus stummii TaxID=3028294 RepID=A0AA96V7T1_9EURY|nr:hypothetical protein [Methanimicrococcus sp. Es2]WNY28317.1 hypothetical protein MmiEs2_05020 [Methanimicrococcus sp. Es2]
MTVFTTFINCKDENCDFMRECGCSVPYLIFINVESGKLIFDCPRQTAVTPTVEQSRRVESTN